MRFAVTGFALMAVGLSELGHAAPTLNCAYRALTVNGEPRVSLFIAGTHAECQLCISSATCTLTGVPGQSPQSRDTGFYCEGDPVQESCPSASDCLDMIEMPRDKLPPAPRYVKKFTAENAGVAAKKKTGKPILTWENVDDDGTKLAPSSAYDCSYSSPVAQVFMGEECLSRLGCFSTIECSVSIRGQERILISTQHLCKASTVGECPAPTDCALDDSFESRAAKIAPKATAAGIGTPPPPGKAKLRK